MAKVRIEVKPDSNDDLKFVLPAPSPGYREAITVEELGIKESALYDITVEKVERWRRVDRSAQGFVPICGKCGASSREGEDHCDGCGAIFSPKIIPWAEAINQDKVRE